MAKKMMIVGALLWILALAGVVGMRCSEDAHAWPQDWPIPPGQPIPARCVQRGSACSAISPCCPGQGTCLKVGSTGTRYDWQCR